MKTTKEAYRYFAFISYSSNDEKYAKVLQKKIETYRLPTVIHKELNERWEGNFPKRLKPIFRDRTDLPAAPLGTSLLRELEDSRYLIVVCSPRSAQSEWVNREVENFILMG
ncbi:MAG: toll/interleukin-1 receptor domain-containing protein, partial [Thermoguttaceae bacterium]|nr:toll/interleukin-1 receptor domain-containing protein [Thermoguttaceae bacterium]